MPLSNAERQKRWRKAHSPPSMVVIRPSPTCTRCGQDLTGRQMKYCSPRCRKLYLGAEAKRRQRIANDPLAVARAEVEAEQQRYIAMRMAERKETVTL